MKKFFFILTGILFALAVSSTAYAADEERFDLKQQPSPNTEQAVNNDQPVPDQSVAHNDNPAVTVGSSMPLTVSAGGRMTLVSGQSITLKPGTKIEAGGYLKASVSSYSPNNSNAQNDAVKGKKRISATARKKPQLLVQTENTISPFPRKSGRSIHENRNDNENLIAQVTQMAGISSEPSRKISAVTSQCSGVNAERITRKFSNYLIPNSQKSETIQVLRL